jgi:hypothetical protein
VEAFSALSSNSVVSQKAPSIPSCLQSKEQVKISWNQVRRVWGYAAVLSRCYSRRIP